MHLVILGPQGSGKGTQATLLKERYGIKYFAMGDRLREEVAGNTEIGKQIKEILDRGDLVPNEITNKIVGKFVKEADAGYIVDGYPRNIEQAAFFDLATTPDVILILIISDNCAVERLAGRRQCPKGHNYHIQYKPPRKEGICDEDGLPLTQRSDDTEDAIRNRLKIYHETTKLVLDHYKDKVLEINGEQTITEVHQEIAKKLKEKELI